MKLWLLVFIFLLYGASAWCQEYVYVNTDNLILRDRPEHSYRVFAILHAPTRLKIVHSDDGYDNDKSVGKRFYQVTVSYTENKSGHTIHGWVEKKYVVTDPEKVTVAGTDKTQEANFDEVGLQPYIGDREHSPNKFNADKFLPPKYKGGEAFAGTQTERRVYHKGPRGGCYYVSKSGKKIYVDKQFCK